MKRLASLLLFACAVAPAQQSTTGRIPQENLYTGDPTGTSCFTNAKVQSTTTGGIYTCVGGVYVSNGSAPASIYDKGGAVFNVKAYGAKGNGRVSDPYQGKQGCATIATSPTVTCADLNFTSADIGKVFTHVTAGTSGAVWKTTVLSVTNSSTAVMSTNAPSSTTAGVSTPTRSIVCTDDTAAITAANSAAVAAGGGQLFFPNGFYCDAGNRTISSNVSWVGINPVSYLVTGSPPDFTIYPSTGSWIDFEGASLGLTGNSLMQVGFVNIGFTDFTKCMSFGTNAVPGLNFATISNAICAGKAISTAANFSTIAWEFYNSQHIYADHMLSSFVNEGLHLVTQGSATTTYTSANNTFKDFYTYDYAHSAANSNVSQPPVLIEAFDGTMGGNVYSGQFQINSYGGDGTNNQLVLNAHSAAIEGQQFNFMDIEGPGACGIEILGQVTNSLFNMNGINATASYCPSATESLNQLIGNLGETIASSLPSTDIISGYLSVPLSTGYTGLWLSGTDGNLFQANLYKAKIANNLVVTGSGGNDGVTTVGGIIALVVNSATGGAPQVQFGGGSGASGVYTQFDNYGEITNVGNCGTIFSTGANSGSSFGCAVQFTNAVSSNRAFTATGSQSVSGCTLSSAAGGTWAGKFASGTTGTCTVTITPGFTATNGFGCIGSDTATHVALTQSGLSATTCIITGSTTSGDAVTWQVWSF